LEKITPDLILLDIVMPKMDGFETIQRIKAIERLKEVPVIFFTSLDESDKLMRGFQLGAVDYVIKPAKKNELLARTRTHLELKFAKDRIMEQNRKIAEQNRKMEKLLHEKNEFMGITAHDLRNPLQSVLSNIELLKLYSNKMTEDQKKERLLQMEDITQRMYLIVNDLLEINKMEEGKLQVNIQKLNIDRIINKLIKSYATVAQKKRINIEYRAETLNKIILADEVKMEQVIENLISNAFKFSPFYTKIIISVEDYDKLNPESKTMLISISDEGPGVKEEEQEKLFDKFSQTSNKPTDNEISSGLGLSIVKRLIETMNGEVWYEYTDETKKSGATFKITIPRPAKEDNEKA
jgi:signal transduction histidine kinase